MKENSVSHNIIEFLNFILINQDNSEQTAILACMMDFKKAFNLINHNLLITKLSDMRGPGWLLGVVMTFLKDRKMVLRYKGKESNIKYLSGGSPKVLLGLLSFFVYINDTGFSDQINNAGGILASTGCFRGNDIMLLPSGPTWEF